MRQLASAAAVSILVASAGASPGSCAEQQTDLPLRVGGFERLAWTQVGDVSTLRFRAYLDGSPVDLDFAVCDTADRAASQAECSAPLPPLTDGVHTIALTAVSTTSGAESGRSESLVLQKIAASGATTASAGRERAAADPTLRPGSVRTSGGLAFAVDVVADDVNGPARLASTPDGRLFLAEADGRVRLLRRDRAQDNDRAVALDARALLEPPPLGPPALALHPDFSRNHFVYLAFLAEHARGGTALRIVRLREVGDTLGEPMALFDAPLALTSRDAPPRALDAAPAGPSATRLDAPRMAFGPDRLLYVALPAGFTFDGEPRASSPVPSVLRLTDEGRVSDALPPLSGIDANPLAFDWHPSTGILWALVPSKDGDVVLRPVTSALATEVDAATSQAVRIAAGETGAQSAALLFHNVPGWPLEPARAFVSIPGRESLDVVTPGQPARSEGLSGLGRIRDVSAGRDGTLFLVTRNGGDANPSGLEKHVLARLTPLR